MRKAVMYYILIFIIVSTGEAVTAQERWSLEECIQYAFENNLDVESKEISSATNREYFQQTKRNRLPSINAGSDYNINFGKVD